MPDKPLILNPKEAINSQHKAAKLSTWLTAPLDNVYLYKKTPETHRCSNLFNCCAGVWTSLTFKVWMIKRSKYVGVFYLGL